jgi:hypothetical protein
MNADDYNDRELRAGNIHPDDITRLTKIAQAALRFPDAEVDGKFGPGTMLAVAGFFAGQPTLEPLTINDQGWLVGGNVKFVPTHPTWLGGTLANGEPGGVVCHVSATNPGTGLNMAKNRARAFVKATDRLSSWHASVEADGCIVQMSSFARVCFHAGSSTAKPIPRLGHANYCTAGIEIVGWEKGPFPEAQVLGYARLLRALRVRYGIKREHAMITHASIDPSRRSDPGPEWMAKHAERVLEMAYT